MRFLCLIINDIDYKYNYYINDIQELNILSSGKGIPVYFTPII